MPVPEALTVLHGWWRCLATFRQAVRSGCLNATVEERRDEVGRGAAQRDFGQKFRTYRSTSRVFVDGEGE